MERLGSNEFQPEFMPQKIDINLSDAFKDLLQENRNKILPITSSLALMTTGDSKGWLGFCGITLALGTVVYLSNKSDLKGEEIRQKKLREDYIRGEKLLDPENKSLRAIIARRDVKRILSDQPDQVKKIIAGRKG